MTNLTHPDAGGSYIRLADGTLQREGAAPEAAVEAPVQGGVESPIKRRSSAPAQPVKES